MSSASGTHDRLGCSVHAALESTGGTHELLRENPPCIPSDTGGTHERLGGRGIDASGACMNVNEGPRGIAPATGGGTHERLCCDSPGANGPRALGIAIGIMGNCGGGPDIDGVGAPCPMRAEGGLSGVHATAAAGCGGPGGATHDGLREMEGPLWLGTALTRGGAGGVMQVAPNNGGATKDGERLVSIGSGYCAEEQLGGGADGLIRDDTLR